MRSADDNRPSETHVVELALLSTDVCACDELVEWVSGAVDGAAL